jgi:nucleoside-diphosphate-sugar epimerase
MLKGKKILITGPGGRIAFPLARYLAKENEVWGVARFSDPLQRQEVEAAGITVRTLDLAEPDFSGIPADFTHLLHLAAAFEPSDYDRAIRVNAEGAGLLLHHCRNVEAALVMSTVSVYKPHPDPWRQFREDDPLGDILAHSAPTYSISKIAEEAVARYCARQFQIPVTIARMNSAYGPRGGLPVSHLQAVAEGRAVETRWDPCPYSPIHDDDIADQAEALLAAASPRATIVNWCGDEVVTVQQWSAYAGELLGVEARVEVTPVPGASLGAAADPAKRQALTGPCKIGWREGFRRTLAALYPDRVGAGFAA